MGSVCPVNASRPNQLSIASHEPLECAIELARLSGMSDLVVGWIFRRDR
jgi:hypothetical protein